MRARGVYNRRGVWGVGSRQLEGGWKGCEGGWHGGWHGGWKPQFPVGRRLEGVTTRRWRCFEGEPNVSTPISLAAKSRSIALARAAAVHPSADGMAADSFGA